MEIPIRPRQAIDQALEGMALAELTRAAANLSKRYRGETGDGALHLSGDLAVKAYLATRLPATYAAVRDAMAKLAELRSDFRPQIFSMRAQGRVRFCGPPPIAGPVLKMHCCLKHRTPSAVAVRR